MMPTASLWERGIRSSGAHSFWVWAQEPVFNTRSMMSPLELFQVPDEEWLGEDARDLAQPDTAVEKQL